MISSLREVRTGWFRRAYAVIQEMPTEGLRRSGLEVLESSLSEHLEAEFVDVVTKLRQGKDQHGNELP